jgi:pimeloyl-ACP methyl ester carboxylesterase
MAAALRAVAIGAKRPTTFRNSSISSRDAGRPELFGQARTLITLVLRIQGSLRSVAILNDKDGALSRGFRRLIQLRGASHAITWIAMSCLLLLTVAAVTLLMGFSRSPTLNAAEVRIASAARAVTADVAFKRLSDGGLLLNGTLEGRQFALAIPRDWNRQAMLFARGYSTPGSSIEVAEDPVESDKFGILSTPYAQGFAVGHSAFDKAGMSVESGVVNTLRLKRFVDSLGATRVYVSGGSMGGNIVVALIEKYPQEFAGGLAACGVVGDWPSEVGRLVDLRAAYNYYTRGTQYALPGNKDLRHSALSPISSGLVRPIAKIKRFLQIKQIAGPVLDLFAAAEKNPGGPEARIIENIAAVTGAEKDVASFGIPLVTVALGMDDLNVSFGGMVYDNRDKQYASPHLTPEENAALNRDIQRTPAADSAAVAKAADWYQSTGRFEVPLLSLFNEIDPLVPSSVQQPKLRFAVEQAGNVERLLQRRVPAMRTKLPGTNAVGYVHCGLTKDQVATAWNDLRGWVETGVRAE